MTEHDIYEVNKRIMAVWSPDFITSVDDLPLDLMWHQPLMEPSVRCSDMFFWACSDSEAITIDNIHHYERAVSDMRELPFDDEAIGETVIKNWAGLLFVARVREIRPQSACYPMIGGAAGDRLIELFDAAGPARDVNIFNPYRHPKDGGGYAYNDDMHGV